MRKATAQILKSNSICENLCAFTGAESHFSISLHVCDEGQIVADNSRNQRNKRFDAYILTIMSAPKDLTNTDLANADITNTESFSPNSISENESLTALQSASTEIAIDDSPNCCILNRVRMDAYDNYFALTKTAVSHHTYQRNNADLTSFVSRVIGKQSGNQKMSPNETGRLDFWSSIVTNIKVIKSDSKTWRQSSQVEHTISADNSAYRSESQCESQIVANMVAHTVENTSGRAVDEISYEL